MNLNFDFKNKTALITGGDTGMGLAMAKAFKRAGADVVICARNEEKLALAAKNFGVYPFVCDVGNEAEVKITVEKAIEKMGQLDFLINNAGLSRLGEIRTLSSEDWHIVMETNLSGTFYFSHFAAQHMAVRRTGRIINTSSIKAKVPEFAYGGYAATKAGIIALTRAMALEMAQFNVTVNAICPGYVDSGHIPQKYYAKLIQEVPQKRMITTEEIANVALFLASEEAYAITGQSINVSGGLIMS